MERSLAVFSGWQIGRREGNVERRGLWGSVSRVHGAQLGEMEMSVLSWISQEWWEQGSSPDGIVRFTWYRLCRDLWPERHDDGGGYRPLAQQAVDNLMRAVVTFGGFSVHTGEWSNDLFSDVHILRSVTRRGGAHSTPELDGGSRESTVEVRLEDWLMAQLLGDVSYLADWEVERTLSGTARRLWYFLGGRSDVFEPTSWPGEEAATFVVDAELFDVLSLRASRPSANRTTLKRAAERIEAVDPRYDRLVVERDPEHPRDWRLRVVRKAQAALAAAA